MVKNIKMLKFKCSKTVATESERILELKTIAGKKGIEAQVDVV